MANPPSERLLASLAELLGPKGFTRAAEDMAPWLEDWRRRFRGRAAAMLSPASTDEVVEIVRRCAAERVALVPQGGNSSMVAGATPGGEGNALLLSLRRMDRIRSLSAAGGSAVCEAGVILARLHEAAAAAGRRFPLSLGAKGSATIGGLVSTNAGGTQVLRFGTMRGLVQGIEAVLPDGSVLNGLGALKKDNRGYDLRQLLVGAEGTLGIVTAASLRLVPAVGSRTVVWAGLSSPDKALQLLRLLEAGTGEMVESFELVPKRALDLVLRHVPGTRAPLAGEHDWHVLVEAAAPIVAPSPEKAVTNALRSALGTGLIEDATVAASEAQADALWKLRESIAEAERHEGPAAKHDISVEVSAMPGFIVAAAKDVESRFPGVQVVAFGHLGDGNIHFNAVAPADAGPQWLEQVGPMVTAHVHDLVVAAGGSISAEHGIGQMRLSELARVTDPVRLRAMAAIKNALDPRGIMNPGKLVPTADMMESLAQAPPSP